jgi:uncharacterized protein YjbI with pentapeptide repeats
MANDKHIAQLRKGVAAWNAWRKQNPDIRPDLIEANLSGMDLSEANLREVYLGGATLVGANLHKSDLSRANLFDADLSGANLWNAYAAQAKLFQTNFFQASLNQVCFNSAKLSGANLRKSELIGASLSYADLSGTALTEANLLGAVFSGSNLSGADLKGAKLHEGMLVNTDLTGADLTGCRIHGVSAWGLKLDGETKQQNLVITPEYEPAITVDNIEIAQFIYLLLNNPKIRDVIDTIGKKAVLILGRFTTERKVVLDALREELRKRDYVPMLFDFDKPASQDLTATVSTLAHLAALSLPT